MRPCSLNKEPDMLRDAIFQIWAPRESVWSPWVKPVLFSHIDSESTGEQLGTVDTRWAEPPDGFTAMVLDIPGPTGIAMGIELVKLGYRLIPLYNACPEGSGRPTVIKCSTDSACIDLGSKLAGES